MLKYTTMNCIYILYRICAHEISEVAWGYIRAIDEVIK